MYRYRLRPGYGSKELLIELLPESANQVFLDDLLGVLSQVNAKVTSMQDLWMNDEVLLSFESDLGPFVVSKDIWDVVFILAPGNQPAILKIEQALHANSQFQKEIVDFDQYKSQS
jgi:hypothetical protein